MRRHVFGTLVGVAVLLIVSGVTSMVAGLVILQPDLLLFGAIVNLLGFIVNRATGLIGEEKSP